jgi:hypothetical protein
MSPKSDTRAGLGFARGLDARKQQCDAVRLPCKLDMHQGSAHFVGKLHHFDIFAPHT